MDYISFSDICGGKIFMDCFGTVRIHDAERFVPGSVKIIEYKKAEFGTAQIMAVSTFEFRFIKDNLAYIDTGHPAHYLAGLLNRFYNNNQPLPPNTKLDHVVLKYLTRNIENQRVYLNEWWQKKIEQQPKNSNPQGTLFL